MWVKTATTLRPPHTGSSVGSRMVVVMPWALESPTRSREPGGGITAETHGKSSLTSRRNHSTGHGTPVASGLAGSAGERGANVVVHSGVQPGDQGSEALWGILLCRQVRMHPWCSSHLQAGELEFSNNAKCCTCRLNWEQWRQVPTSWWLTRKPGTRSRLWRTVSSSSTAHSCIRLYWN